MKKVSERSFDIIVVPHFYRMVIFTQKLNTCSTIFSVPILGSFCYPSPFFHKALPRRAKGDYCPRRLLRMRLGRIVRRFCGQGERPHLFPGKSFLRGRPQLVLGTSATTTRPPEPCPQLYKLYKLSTFN
ncbi:hypothetical protein BREVNS_2119 [Brevinematales bacterium NS]|nr:hypothetical protein BREVNS_2119 [Brevinematales bacterium NS]